MGTISRRRFIQKTGLAGLLSFFPSVFFPSHLFSGNKTEIPDLAVISGENIFENTRKIIDILGGIRRFVKPGQSVGLLVNSAFDNQGAYVHPDIPLAVAEACFGQGASEVRCIQNIELKYWQRSKYYDELQSIIERLTNNTFNKFPSKFQEEYFIHQEIEGIYLKKAEIVKSFMDCDVLFNISIAKHHGSTIYTGALKNIMGISTRDTNVTFHLNGPARNDPEYLAQCIADLNTLRKFDLTIIDVSEVMISNGPSGPGEVIHPGKIIAGTDIVATDSLATTMIGHEMGDILTVKRAWEFGLGEMDFNKYSILYS